MMMSTDLAFEDFLRSRSPLQVQLEFSPTPFRDREAALYQAHTHRLVDALRSGSRQQLALVVFTMEMAA